MISHAQDTSLFAHRMKKARERLGITQMELGVRAGIDECSASSRINQYERGKHFPDFSTASRLAKVLGVPTAYFYTEDDGLSELIILYGKLKISERKELVALTESLANQIGSSK
jgi:transcriptional regulator with XRE-family HTH domain